MSRYRPFRHAAMRSLAYLGWACAGPSMAQPLTDIGLFQSTSFNTVEVRVRPDAPFSELVSATTFTVRWETASGATIPSAPLGLNCPSGIPLAASPDGTVINGAFSYYSFNAFGGQQLGSACAAQVWQANVERTIASIPIRPGASCARFNISNDVFTLQQNRGYYLSLNGVDRTDQIYSADVRVLRGDLNRNGSVDPTDFAIFVAAFGSACTGCGPDLNFDALVNVPDFAFFVEAYGRTCP